MLHCVSIGPTLDIHRDRPVEQTVKIQLVGDEDGAWCAGLLFARQNLSDLLREMMGVYFPDIRTTVESRREFPYQHAPRSVWGHHSRMMNTGPETWQIEVTLNWHGTSDEMSSFLLNLCGMRGDMNSVRSIDRAMRSIATSYLRHHMDELPDRRTVIQYVTDAVTARFIGRVGVATEMENALNSCLQAICQREVDLDDDHALLLPSVRRGIEDAINPTTAGFTHRAMDPARGSDRTVVN